MLRSLSIILWTSCHYSYFVDFPANKHLRVSDRTDKKSKCLTTGTRKTIHLPNLKTLKVTRNKFMLERERDSTWVGSGIHVGQRQDRVLRTRFAYYYGYTNAQWLSWTNSISSLSHSVLAFQISPHRFVGRSVEDAHMVWPAPCSTHS